MIQSNNFSFGKYCELTEVINGMKKILVLMALIAVLILLAGCDGIPSEKWITSAKIRYFDGSMDTVIVDSFNIGAGGIMHIRTDSGRTITIGPNNAIIIYETEAQFNCQE